MAGHDVATDGDAAPKKGKKKLIIIVLAVLLLAGAGAGAYFGGFIGGKHEAGEEAEAEPETHGAKKEEEHAGKKEAEAEHGGKKAEAEEEKPEGHGGKEGGEAKASVPGMPEFFPLPDFLVNLNTGSAQVSFLKASIVLEVAKAEDVARVQALQPRIVDDFTTYMRELRSSDLAGSAGLERLREELLSRVNKAIAPAKVDNILFKEFIVQ